MRGTKSISNSADFIDSREVADRIAYLEGLDEQDDDEKDEYRALVALRDDAEGYAPDWKYGATLICDSYFEDYARELAEDIGAIQDDAKWPATCIDWKEAARELQQDYTSVEFDGVTYWVR